MRQIKFRAWDNLNKKWLLGYEYKNLGGFSLTGECVLFGEWGNVFDAFLFNKDGKKWGDLKIMQFIGLQDKNGKDIYEGDIISYPDKEIAEIYFRDEEAKIRSIEFGFNKDLYSRPMTKRASIFTEVIGNIYETPKLLNSK